MLTHSDCIMTVKYDDGELLSFGSRSYSVLQEYSMWLCDELGMEKNSKELHVVTPLHLRKFEVLSRQERYN